MMLQMAMLSDCCVRVGGLHGGDLGGVLNAVPVPTGLAHAPLSDSATDHRRGTSPFGLRCTNAPLSAHHARRPQDAARAHSVVSRGAQGSQWYFSALDNGNEAKR